MKESINRWWKPLLATTLLATGAACGDDPGDVSPNLPTPEIANFESDPAAITAGTNIRGNDVQGEALLQWEIDDAASIALFTSDEELDLADCEPVGDGEECLPAGQIEVSPQEATTYRLDAVNDEELSCVFGDDDEISNDEACDSLRAEVDVRPPALLAFESETDRFDPGSDFVVNYEVEHAEEWEVGIVDGDDFVACEVDANDGPCAIDGDEEGQLTLRELGDEQAVVLSGWATNGADDELGDVEVGDVELSLTAQGAPLVRSFSADPTHVPFGEVAELSWEVEDAESVEISADAEVVIDSDLGDCMDVDADGMGQCDVQFAQEAPELTVTFTLVAHGEGDQESAPAEFPVVLGAAPQIDSFEISPPELPESGGDVQVSWETSGGVSKLMLIDDAEPVNTLLDTGEGIGLEQCQQDSGECHLEADALAIDDVESNTQYTLVASSPLGSDSASVNVSIEGAPQITAVAIDGEDGLDQPVIVDGESAEISWETMAADGTTLERAPRPDDGCSSPEIEWVEVSDFAGDASGSDTVAGLDMMRQCFRLRALGEAEQRASQIFEIVRHPEIALFDLSPQTLETGDTLELYWETPFATSVEVDISPQGSVASSELEDCMDVSAANDAGTCEVTIQPGSPLGDVDFSLMAYGYEASEAGPQQETITVGTGAEITAFGSDPATADEETTDVTLSWESTDATELTVSDDSGEVFFSDDAAEITSGQTVIADVSATTTWTLEVSNQFGDDSANTTTFFGPSAESLVVNGVDALDGSASVLSGDILVEWTTANADSSILDRADVPAGQANCEGATGWGELESLSTGDGEFLEPEVLQNGCYRLILENEAGQASEVRFQVTEVPFLTAMITNVDSIDGNNGGTVTVEMSFVAASELAVRAIYRDSDDEVVEERQICSEDSLNSGSLDPASTDEATVTCTHSMDGPCSGLGCLAVDDDPPSDTDYIEYEVEFADPEGDGAVETTEEAEQVEVQF